MFWYYRNSTLESLHQPPEMESSHEGITHTDSSFQVFQPTVLMAIDKVKQK